MTERPIIFSGPMVRAILEGRKTQTRRIVKPQPEEKGAGGGEVLRKGYKPGEHDSTRYDPNANPYFYWKHPRLNCGYCHTGREAMERLMEPLCPYGQPGDRLWVRESSLELGSGEWTYRADNAPVMVPAAHKTEMIAWAHHKKQSYCPSIHMPRWASRITLEVVSVRVERVLQISGADAIAEGVQVPVTTGGAQPGKAYPLYPITTNPTPHEFNRAPWEKWPEADYYRLWFAILWNEINGKRSPWAANPWVWVLEFRRVA